MSTLAEDLRVLALKKRAAAITMKVAEYAKKDAKAWEQHCYDRIDSDLGTDSDGGAAIRNERGTFVASETTFAQIKDRAVFEAWAATQDESYFDDEPKPREALLNQLVREKIDNKEPLPPGLGVYGRRRVTVRGGR